MWKSQQRRSTEKILPPQNQLLSTGRHRRSRLGRRCPTGRRRPKTNTGTAICVSSGSFQFPKINARRVYRQCSPCISRVNGALDLAISAIRPNRPIVAVTRWRGGAGNILLNKNFWKCDEPPGDKHRSDRDTPAHSGPPVVSTWMLTCIPLRDIRGACESIWPHLNAMSRSAARPWSGWTSMNGTLVASCSSATPRTPARHRWARQAGWPWKTRVRPVRSVGLGSDGGESADRRRQQTQATNQVGLRDKRKGPEADIHVLCDLRL